VTSTHTGVSRYLLASRWSLNAVIRHNIHMAFAVSYL